MKRTLLSLPLLFIISIISLKSQEILKNYIDIGLNSNQFLKQKQISYSQAISALNESRKYFYPSMDLNMLALSGEGGRSIDLPVGDLLNPVYATLNALTNSKLFPQINNVSQSYLPNQSYDFKIKSTIPIYNYGAEVNYSIQENQVSIKKSDIDAYKRDLIKEIKVAYYNYLSALQQEEIYKFALDITTEAKRVNQSLVDNGDIQTSYLLRSESEVQQVLSKIQDSKNQTMAVQRYFNFLLNRELNSRIDIDTTSNITELMKLDMSQNSSILNDKREELLMLKELIYLRQNQLKISENYWIPSINAFADLGIQSDKFKFDNKSNYYIVGVQLDMHLFDFFGSKSKIEVAEKEIELANLEYERVKNQLDILSKNSIDNFILAIENYKSSEKQLNAATSYYNLVSKGYKEGANSFIESLDGRVQLTQAQLLNNIKKYQILIAKANLDRELLID